MHKNTEQIADAGDLDLFVVVFVTFFLARIPVVLKAVVIIRF